MLRLASDQPMPDAPAYEAAPITMKDGKVENKGKGGEHVIEKTGQGASGGGGGGSGGGKKKKKGKK